MDQRLFLFDFFSFKPISLEVWGVGWVDWLCFNDGHCWFRGNAHYETDNSWTRGSQRGRVCSHSFKGRMKESLPSIFFFFYPNQSVFYCCLFTVFLLAVLQLMFISPPSLILNCHISYLRAAAAAPVKVSGLVGFRGCFAGCYSTSPLLYPPAPSISPPRLICHAVSSPSPPLIPLGTI